MGVLGDPRRPALLVVEDEHADSAGLPVANRREHGRSDALHGCAQGLCDRADLVGRPRAEEGDRDVQVLQGTGRTPCSGSSSRCHRWTPGRRVRADGNRGRGGGAHRPRRYPTGHAEVSRLRVRSSRRRWSAAGGRPAPDRLAVTREVQLARAAPAGARCVQVDEPDGLLRSPAAGPRDPRDGDGHVGAEGLRAPSTAMAAAVSAETAPCAASVFSGRRAAPA